jgi:nitrite reductase/ring-hydroxylating ferredoxin subunit
VRQACPDGTALLCHRDELDEGAARGFKLFGHARDTLFVIRRGATLLGYLNRCPHQGASLPWRTNAYLNATRTRIVCSAHGAQFDPDSGRCLAGPALGASLSAVDLEVDSEGWVRARIDDRQ